LGELFHVKPLLFEGYCFTEQVNLVTSGLFKLVDIYDLGLPLLPPLYYIIAHHGLAVWLYMPSGF